MINSNSTVLLIISFTFQLCVGQTSKEIIPVFTPSDSSIIDINENQTYTFGYLEVPENRSDPESNSIKLPVYIFKSRHPNPPKDPIIYTVGGPGSTTMPSAQYMAYYSYLDDRDFILFEQRGNYYAQPHLDCPEWSQAIYQANLPGVDTHTADSLLADAAASCRQRLVEQGIDLNGYHTKEIAADIEDLRKALGIDSYNLLTISYSTKIAQVLMRDYPNGIRSVVMDSPLPLEVNYDEESVGNLMEALDQLLSDCESEVDCKTAFPNIKERLHDYLKNITENPLIVKVAHPENGNQETFYLSGKELIAVFTSAATGGVSNIPWEIHKILNGELSAVKTQLAQLLEGPGYSDGIGMRLSVWCAEEYPFSSQEVIRVEKKRYPEVKGLSPAVFDSTVCEIWGVEAMGERENKAVKSDIPVLLISGEYDNETPPEWASAMQENLPNSYHMIFKGWKHTPTTNWGNPCAMKMAQAFFNDPSEKPEIACFQDLEKVKFMVE